MESVAWRRRPLVAAFTPLFFNWRGGGACACVSHETRSSILDSGDGALYICLPRTKPICLALFTSALLSGTLLFDAPTFTCSPLPPLFLNRRRVVQFAKLKVQKTTRPLPKCPDDQLGFGKVRVHIIRNSVPIDAFILSPACVADRSSLIFCFPGTEG